MNGKVSNTIVNDFQRIQKDSFMATRNLLTAKFA